MNNDTMLYGYGIYGLFYKDELVYIGMTEKSFANRIKGYLEDVADVKKNRPAVQFIRDHNNEVEFRPLINVMDLRVKDKTGIKTRDIQMMELALISLYKPMLNMQGVRDVYPLRRC